MAVAVCLGRGQAHAVNVYQNPNTFEGATAPLKVGDRPPPLTGAAWLNGEPVTEFKQGTVYLIEFWATWCLPCQKSLPHLNELQKRYQGRLRVLGIAAAEEAGLEGLKRFLAQGRVNFPVAYVDDEETFNRWMHAARVSGLPWVFVIDGAGRIAWWGQPFQREFDSVVSRVVQGRFPLAAESARRAKKLDNDRRGWFLQSEVRGARKRGDRAAALALLDELIQLNPERFWAEVAMKTSLLLESKADRERGLTFARTAIDTLVSNNPHALTMLAQSLRGQGGRDTASLALAAKAARRASELTAGKDPDVQSTLESITALQAAASSKTKDQLIER